MGPEIVGELIPIILGVAAFAMIFGIRYLNNRENLAMVEKGMNPRLIERRPTPYKNLKWGLLLVGSGIGLFVAYLLDNFVLYRIGRGSMNHFDDDSNIAIYFALIAIGGGLGLISSYRIEKKELLDRKDPE